MSARTRSTRRERAEAGISTVEVVIALPVMVAFMLIAVSLGFYAEDISKVQEAAADAARMASVQGPDGDMTVAARRAAWSDLQYTCTRDDATDLAVTPTTRTIKVKQTTHKGSTSAQSSIQVVNVSVTCDFTLFGKNLSVTESSYAPLDYFREQ